MKTLKKENETPTQLDLARDILRWIASHNSSFPYMPTKEKAIKALNNLLDSVLEDIRNF